MNADIILTGGPVYVSRNEGLAEAVVIKDGRILETGCWTDLKSHRSAKTRIIDLDGRCAIPGFNDAHLHLLTIGLGMREINLRTESGVKSVDEILRRIAERAAKAEPGEWLKGRGYDHNELVDRRHPTAAELDRAAPHNPVYIERTCGHIAVANTAALRAAGIGPETADPEGGLIERHGGVLTGLLAERAMRLVVDVLPRPSRDEMVDAIANAGRFLLSQGITSVMDAAIGMNAGFEELEAFEEAARDGRLPVRVWACLYGDPGGIVDQAHAAGYRARRENGLLRYGAAKVFTDGSAGSLTAAMSEAYRVGEEGNLGILCFEDDHVHTLLRRYHEMGYQLAIHAIGDRAIEQVLTGIERAGNPGHPVAGRRHRIEHCGFLTTEQMDRMKAAGVLPVPQPAFMYEFGDLYIKNLGPERAAAAYPMKTWLSQGSNPSASSDAPVCSTDPFKNLFAMITRKTRSGTVIGEDQALSIHDAIHAYTYCSAYTQFAETQIGCLLPGMKADLAILSADIFATPVSELENNVRCDLTILDGQVVFER